MCPQGGNKLCLVHQIEENVTSGPVGETMHQSWNVLTDNRKLAKQLKHKQLNLNK